MTTRVVAPSGRMRSASAAQRVRRFLGFAGSQLPQSPVMRGVPGDEPQPRIVKRSLSPTGYAATSSGRRILLKRRKKLLVVIAAISSAADADRLAEHARRVGHVGRLVALAPKRHRRQVGRVGLDQQPVARARRRRWRATRREFLKVRMPEKET